jgi:hypothetical protein
MTGGDTPLCRGTTVTIDASARKRSISELRGATNPDDLKKAPCYCHVVADIVKPKSGAIGAERERIKTRAKVGGVSGKKELVQLKDVHVGACCRCVMLRCVDLRAWLK